jgi:hypothetical protein
MADTPYREADIGRHPTKIWPSTTALPAELPKAGYGHIVICDTPEGARLFVQLETGQMIPCFANTTVIDNTVTLDETKTELIYKFDDLPNPPLLGQVVPVIMNGSWTWVQVNDLLAYKPLRSSRHVREIHTNEAFTLEPVHLNKYLSCFNLYLMTITIPVVPQGLQGWPVDENGYWEIEFARNEVGEIHLVPSPDAPMGVKINGQSKTIRISKQWGIVVMKWIGLNQWVAYGDFEYVD